MIIDIHSHIIPNIDDGSKSIEMTLEMLRKHEKEGFNHIVATPHYLLEYGEATIEEVKKYVKELNNIAENEKINVKIYSGQEVYYTEKIIEDYIQGKIGTINDSKYMLIEFDMHKFDDTIFDNLYELQVKGIIPIIAHPERYKYFREKPTMINKFINEGYLFQMNAGSIEGKFGETVRKTANIFLENNIYNFIGSDAHDNKNRNTGILNALNSIKNSKTKNIVKDSCEKLLNNGMIIFSGNIIKERKSIFSIFRK